MSKDINQGQETEVETVSAEPAAEQSSAESNENWQQISLITTQEKAEEISDLLTELGAVAVTYMDAQDDPILEPLPGEQRLWPNTKVIGLYEKGTDVTPIVTYLQHAYGDNFPIAAHELEDQDWVRAWMDNFKPIQCGSKLWICPTWCQVPAEDAITVMLDPGLAFGTGTHPTTFLCLEFLDSMQEQLKGLDIVDYGCGSGILAIAALKLGAHQAYGVDIDPQALIASKDNAERNGVVDKLKLFDGSKQEIAPCPFVVANILAGPLAELEPHIAALCQTGGHLALSGILMGQVDEIVEAYQGDFEILEIKEQDNWALVVGKRR